MVFLQSINLQSINISKRFIIEFDSQNNYVWYPNGETTSSITVSPSTTTTYKVDVTTGSSTCQDSVTVTANEINLVPSLLREFSAPVILETDLNIDEYIHILKFDNDSFNRWDAIQNLYLDCYLNKSNVKLLCDTLRIILSDKKIDFSLMALFLELL